MGKQNEQQKAQQHSELCDEGLSIAFKFILSIAFHSYDYERIQAVCRSNLSISFHSNDHFNLKGLFIYIFIYNECIPQVKVSNNGAVTEIRE